MARRGFKISLFLPDGTPDGLRIVEKSNWIGKGIVCPRPVLSEARTRQDFEKTGVYLLLGPGESADLPRIYVGEGDPCRPRIDSHDKQKDFWITVVLFVSKDDNLNKAHVQYLESRLVGLAKETKRSVLENGNLPQPPSLSEADVAEMEGFLDEMLLILPVLGVSAFEKPRKELPTTTILYLRTRGLAASGYESSQGFVVQKGSESSIDVVPSVEQHVPYVLELRNTLLEQGIFSKRADRLVLEQDYLFASPSTAASVMMARNANGRIEWKTSDGRTLRELQTAR